MDTSKSLGIKNILILFKITHIYTYYTIVKPIVSLSCSESKLLYKRNRIIITTSFSNLPPIFSKLMNLNWSNENSTKIYNSIFKIVCSKNKKLEFFCLYLFVHLTLKTNFEKVFKTKCFKIISYLNYCRINSIFMTS